MERRVLNIFIASPSDLADERKTIREIVDRINKVFGRRMGIQIELLGWEDTLPGFARPQELINKDVEVCDLFIGILWKRWGTESGEYGSGFEEEFHVARERKLSGDNIDIWMFFKNVGSDHLSDPGPQLEKVIQFKKDLIMGKELLFKDFPDDDSGKFQNLIHDDLTAFLLNEIQKDTNNLRDNTSYKSVSADSVRSSVDNVIEGSPKEQLLANYSDITNHINSDSLDEISFWNRLRCFLSTTALFSEVHIGELLGIHELNLVYRKRKEWDLNLHERWAVIRSHLGSHEFVPGRYWLSEDFGENLSDLLEDIAKNDLNIEVRKGSINLLKSLNYIPKVDFVRSLLETDDVGLKIQTIKLSSHCQDKEVLKVLENMTDDENVVVSAEATSFYIDFLYQYEPERSFIYLAENSSVVTPLYGDKLKTKDLNVDITIIRDYGLNSNTAIRLYAAQYLYTTGSLDSDTANTMIKDIDSHVRKVGFDYLINNGREFTLSEVAKLFPKPKTTNTGLLGLSNKEVTEDEIIPILLKKKTKNELEEMVEFYSIDGRRAYEILANKYSHEIASRLRDDLKNEFQNIKDVSFERMKAKYGEAADELIKSYTSPVIEYLEVQFSASALSGLLSENEMTDIEYARKYISRFSIAESWLAAVLLIEKYGDEGDVELLLGVARKAYAEDQSKAIDVALNLSSEKNDLLFALASDENSVIASVATSKISMLDRYDKLDFFKKLLYSKHDGVRTISAKSIVKLVGKEELESYLDKYVESDSYFYDVVKIFDESIYEVIL